MTVSLYDISMQPPGIAVNISWTKEADKRVALPVYQTDGMGDPILDPTTGLPLQVRGGMGVRCSASGLTCVDVAIDTLGASGDPDPLGVFLGPSMVLPDSVFYHHYAEDFPGQGSIFSSNRPGVGPGHPLAGRRQENLRPELVVPFASELAGT